LTPSIPVLTMSTSGLKAIAPVPTAADFLDIVLSKTQRKTPTVRPSIIIHLTFIHFFISFTQVIHKNFKISRIRNFYMRKVKFTQDSFDEKLGAILTEFPMLDVRLGLCLKNDTSYIYDVPGLASVFILADECSLRQESL
jgi:NOG1 N-terminal helical domain